MAKIALASYTIRVREKHRNTPLPLGQLEFGHRFLEEFRVFVTSLQREHRHDPTVKSVLTVTDLHEEGRNVVWGLVNAGAYGFRRDVVSSATLQHAYRVAPNEAVLHPFYFLLDAPDASNRAIYILQRHGNIGVHTSFTNHFRQFFSERNPNLIFDVVPHVPREVFRYLRDGALKRVEFRSYRVPHELEEKVRLGANPDDKVLVRTVVTARGRGNSLPKPEWVQRLVDRRANRQQLMEAEPVQNVEPEELTLTFSYHGNERSLNLAKPDAIAPYVDVSEEVELNDEGHPIPEQVHAAASKLRDDIVAEMGRI